MTTQSDTDPDREAATTIDRREAVRRVVAMLGGLTLVGGSSLMAACERQRPGGPRVPIGAFTVEDIDLLDEIADTILPETKTPGAKAANTGAFMALMVTDTYKPYDAQVFRDGLRTLDALCFQANKTSFVAAKPAQRLALLENVDREAKSYMDLRARARKSRQAADSATTSSEPNASAKHLPDQRQQAAASTESNPAPAITTDPPPHYFRMMKELAMLGYFTSEIGCTQALRYVEMPGRFDPCVDYKPGDRAWAGHA
jgi:hypothetical protein